MQVLHDTLADDPNITLLTVHVDGRGDPESYLDQNGYSFPVVLNGGTMAGAFAVTAVPTFVVIGPDGTIVDRHVGQLNDRARDRLLESARTARR